jgi:mRNA interferase YafQ
MLSITYTNQFKKDFKKVQKRGLNLAELQKLIELIVNEQPIPAKYKNHKLIGDYKDIWDCHIKPDWLLFYQIDEKNKEVTFVRTGSHSDLF